MKFPVFSLLAGNLAFSETSSQLTHRLHEVERGAHRPSGVVLVCLRVAEIGRVRFRPRELHCGFEEAL